jgi:uncharacterized phage protein (TIGR02220 family)
MYNKLFTKILDSSIWMEPTPTRIVWLTLIAAMDEIGFVPFASVANLAHRAIVPLKDAEEAVKCLESPDENSSDPEFEGRRIERVSGGWMILNAEKYRALGTRAIIQEQTRVRVRKYRERKKCNADVTHDNENVTPSIAIALSEAVKKESTLLCRVKNTRRQKSPELVSQAGEILNFLNLKTKRQYRAVDANLDLIISRLESGVAAQDFKCVIAKKTREWLTDPKMETYLRPKTLFNKTNFEQYLGELLTDEQVTQ